MITTQILWINWSMNWVRRTIYWNRLKWRGKNNLKKSMKWSKSCLKKKYTAHSYFCYLMFQQDCVLFLRDCYIFVILKGDIRKNNVSFCRQEAILAAISEKDAHLALLEMNGPKKPKVMEEIARLNKEKDQLQMQLRDVVRYVEIFQVKKLWKIKNGFFKISRHFRVWKALVIKFVMFK